MLKRLCIILVLVSLLGAPLWCASPKSWLALDGGSGVTPDVYKWSGGSGTLQVWGPFTSGPAVSLEWTSFSSAPFLEIDATACTLTAADTFCNFSIGNGNLRLVITGGSGVGIVSARIGSTNQASIGGAGGGVAGSLFWIDDGSVGSGLVPGNADAIQVSNDGVGGGNITAVLADTAGQTDDVFRIIGSDGTDELLAVDNVGRWFIDHADSETGPQIRFLDGANQDSWHLRLQDSAGDAGGIRFARASSDFLAIGTDNVTLGAANGPKLNRATSTLTNATLFPNAAVTIGLGGDLTDGSLVHGSTSALQWNAVSATIPPGLTFALPSSAAIPVACSGAFSGHVYWDTNQAIICRCDGTLWEGMVVGGGAPITCT